MYIYLILLGLIALYSLYPDYKHNSRQSRRIFLIFAFSSMAVVLGLRGNTVGEDTAHYLHIFERAADVKWLDMLRNINMRTPYYTAPDGYTDTIENGFLALAKIVHLFTNNGQVFLFLVSGLTCYLFAKFIYDNSERVVFPTYIFLCESMFMISFNGVRQILAAAIAIQAYTLLKKKKWKKAVFVIVLAALIHNVAFICFAFFPVAFIKPRKEYKTFKYVFVMVVAAPFAVILGQNLVVRVFPRYAAYFTTNFWSNGLGGTTVLWMIEFALVLAMYWKKFKSDSSFKLACFVLIYLTCELVGLRITMFSRVGWFFRPYLILFFPDCKKYFEKKTWRMIQLVLILMLGLLYLSYAKTPARQYLFFWQYG